MKMIHYTEHTTNPFLKNEKKNEQKFKTIIVINQ